MKARDLAERSRIGLSAEYSGEAYHFFASAALLKAVTTKRARRRPLERLYLPSTDDVVAAVLLDGGRNPGRILVELIGIGDLDVRDEEAGGRRLSRDGSCAKGSERDARDERHCD